MRAIILALLLLPAFGAARNAVLELTDGSTVHGEITALANGEYTVQSAALGRLQVPQERVRAIRYDQAEGPGGGGDAATRTQVADLQQSLARDPELMGQIQALGSDPQIQAVLADPEIVRAIQAGDLTALMANPKFMALLENARLKAVTGQVMEGR